MMMKETDESEVVKFAILPGTLLELRDGHYSIVRMSSTNSMSRSASDTLEASFDA